LGEQPCRTVGEVVLSRRHPVGAPPGDGHADPISGFGPHLLEQADRLEHGGQRVITVGTRRPDPQPQVDLARGPYQHAVIGGYRRAHCGCPTGPSTPGEAMPVIPASAMAANALTSRRSPRMVGSTPARRRTRSAAVVDPAHGESAERNILRRWANAVSITVKTCSREALVAGGSRRCRCTSA